MKSVQKTQRPTPLPVILLHGWAIDPQNQQKWRPFMEQLDSTGWSLRFLDLPGFGTEPLTEAWRLNDYVNWLHHQLKSQPQLVLLGHSFGGQLAVRYASVFPEQVAGLVLLDPAGIRPRTFQAKLKRRLFGSAAKLGRAVLPFELGRQVLHRLAGERDYLQAPPVMRQTMQWVLADEITADFSRIQAPTCIIWGDHDTAAPVAHAPLFAAGIRGSQVHYIAGARHSPHYTHVEVTARQVRHFLEQLVERQV